MQIVQLPWGTRRAVNDALRTRRLPYALEHADHRLPRLATVALWRASVTLHLTGDPFPRSFDWARRQPRIPLPVEG
jgi:hypothetical protein